MKKVRSGRSKRIDYNILSSKFKVTSCTSNNEEVGKIIVKEKTSEGIKNIKKRKAMGERSRNSLKKFKNPEKEEVQEDQPDLPLSFKEKIEQMEGKIKESSLLTEEEGLSLDYVPQKKGTRKLEGMSVSMLDTNLKLWDKMCFKKWKMGKSEVYNITGAWYKLVEQDQKIQLWSFKRDNHLNFALVKL
ncbi:unnamed protein product [Trifolium pratense]|uniref:Uncharacterized protein n=1 Tax=Trifolium pratense TaxID=57577 RepID=A0ACB0IQW9_TRIPR|nr:unnamed protein product [Trifolium pratense]